MRKTKNIIGILALAIFVIGAIVIVAQKQPATLPATPDAATSFASSTQLPKMQATAPAGASTTASGYTLADVAKHNSQTSCWSAINGSVYDLTSWISQHPGGEGAILSICGKDGSSAFNGQHGSDARPNAMLATFKIGTLNS